MGNVYAEFLLNAGLYNKLTITQDNIGDLISLIGGSIKLNLFCKECGDTRVFSMQSITNPDYNEMRQAYILRSLSEELQTLQNHGFGKDVTTPDGTIQVWAWKNWQCENAARLITFSFHCAMDETHTVDFVVLTTEDSFIKIGQYPSIADLTFPELKQYSKILSKDDMSEMRRAIGLHAQGIGVGSYVYLRRILERIIDSAKDLALADGKITEDGYARSRVSERISLLKDYLPNVLVNNPTLYGIISKGIHELSEAECIAYFPVIKECIFMILEKWEQERKQAESEKALSASLNQIASKISQS